MAEIVTVFWYFVAAVLLIFAGIGVMLPVAFLISVVYNLIRYYIEKRR